MMDPSTYIEEENGILLTTLVHIRVALGTCEGIGHTIRETDYTMELGHQDTMEEGV